MEAEEEEDLGSNFNNIGMEGQIQNQPKSDAKEAEAARRPAIRTMKSDVQELFKTTKPSLLQIIGQEGQSSRPSLAAKKGWALYLLAGAVALAAIAAGIFYFFPSAPAEEAKKLVPPAPFFAVESARTISAETRNQFINLMQDSAVELERTGTIKRVIAKITNGAEERFLRFADLAEFYLWFPPKTMAARISGPVMLFFYRQDQTSRFGFAARTTDPDRTLFEMLSWEATMVSDFRPVFFHNRPDLVSAPFEDRTFRNIDWRYQKLSQSRDLGIGYAVFPAKNLLVVTTSKEMMETVISRLFSAP